MSQLDTPNYAAWHIPCYANHNCPKRTPKLSNEVTTPTPIRYASFYVLFGSEINDNETGLVAFFLWSLIVLAIVGICVVGGALVMRNGFKRPFNQFLMFMMKSDFTMAMFVIPLHAVEVLANQKEEPPFGPAVCLAGTFVHLVSTCTRAWSIAAFLLLHHLHSGYIPSGHSIIILVWIWIASVLVSLPIVISGDGSLVDMTTCTLVADSYGMVIYVTVINYFLPAFILAPLFIRWSHLTERFSLRRDISCDVLADGESLYEVEMHRHNSVYYTQSDSNKTSQRKLINTKYSTTADETNIIRDNAEHLNSDEHVQEQKSHQLQKNPNCIKELDSIEDGTLYDTQNLRKQATGIAKSEILGEALDIDQSLDSLEFYRKPSRMTQLFLIADSNFPRTLFTMAVLQVITWGPFYLIILISPLLATPVPRAFSLFGAWLGYSQCAITPIFIYLLSDRVFKLLNDLISPYLSYCRRSKSETKSNTFKENKGDLDTKILQI